MQYENNSFSNFELRRLSDSLVYRFHRHIFTDGTIGYRRQDIDLWILRRPTIGWVALDPDTSEITGRPWNILPKDQQNYPPEDEWVSKKGEKSYVYRLVYVM